VRATQPPVRKIASRAQNQGESQPSTEAPVDGEISVATTRERRHERDEDVRTLEWRGDDVRTLEWRDEDVRTLEWRGEGRWATSTSARSMSHTGAPRRHQSAGGKRAIRDAPMSRLV
jgi:hypothetical protein